MKKDKVDREENLNENPFFEFWWLMYITRE